VPKSIILFEKNEISDINYNLNMMESCIEEIKKEYNINQKDTRYLTEFYKKLEKLKTYFII
jgi:hypothetical protein